MQIFNFFLPTIRKFWFSLLSVGMGGRGERMVLSTIGLLASTYTRINGSYTVQA